MEAVTTDAVAAVPLCLDGTHEHIWQDEPTDPLPVLRLTQRCPVCRATRFVYRIGDRDVVRYGRAKR